MSNSNQLMARLSQLSPEQREALLKKLQQQKQQASVPNSSIPVQPRDQGLPLSFPQQRLWFLQQLEGPSATYNVAAAIRLKGDLNVEALRRTIETIVGRHEILRTVFIEERGQAVQRIARTGNWLLPVEDISQLPDDERERVRKARVRDAAQTPFDIAQGPLMRTSLLRVGGTEHILLTTMHHIISDGWSVRVLLREITAIYSALNRNEPSPLPPLAIQYADFATWQRHYFDDKRLAPQLDYWRHQLAGAEVLELPTDRPRPPQMRYRGNYYQFSLPKPLLDGLNRLSQQQGATLFMTLLAAFQSLLHRYSGQNDICVGSPIANRTRSDIEPLIGLFVNSLALRSQIDSQQTFIELLKRLQKTTLDAYANQDVPFERLVDVLGVPRDTSHAPLFQVFFSLTNGEAERNLTLDNLTAEFLPADIDSAKFDLSLLATEYRDRLVCQLEYSSDLFDRDTIVRMGLHFSELVAGIVANPMARIGRLPLLDRDEQQQLLVDWNQTTRAYPHTTVTALIEAQAQQTPLATAVRCGADTLNYAELDTRANALAAHLQQHGVVRGDRVGLCLPRSVDLITAVFAVLKTGAAYVPMDTSYPADRLQHMADNANMKLLLTHSSLRDRMPAHKGFTASIDDVDLTRSALTGASSRASVETDADDLLYVVYTSGSTGLPKGAGVRHRNEVNLLQWYLREYNINNADSVLVISAFGFDLTQKNLLAPLVAGACVVLPQSDHYDHLEALNLVRQHKITLMNCAPSAFYPLVSAAEKPEHLDSLRVVLFGGEPIRMENLARWFERKEFSAHIVNMYGPTECTDIAASYTITKPQQFLTRSVPVGRPNDNVRLYVLDELLQPVPVGVIGELYIGGDGVGAGYINNDEMTAQKFVRNPFAPGLMYRTGDLVRYRPHNGANNLEFVARADGQVKVRGFRIELGEIEAQLNRHALVNESVVTAVIGSAGAVLVGYVVAGADIDAYAIQAFLRHSLPEYMVPSVIIAIDRIPLTPNGKVDRKALPQPDLSQIGRKPYVAPRNDTESLLCSIWQQLLATESLGVHDNFFDVGGHSLLATQLITRIRDQFQLELPLKTLFEMPTIGGLAELIQSLVPQSHRNQAHSLEPHALQATAGNADSDDEFEEGIL
jgi:amino acid adenylation domain-containing protein